MATITVSVPDARVHQLEGFEKQGLEDGFYLYLGKTSPHDEGWAVHNHGPAEGTGSRCREYTINNRLVGACHLADALRQT